MHLQFSLVVVFVLKYDLRMFTVLSSQGGVESFSKQQKVNNWFHKYLAVKNPVSQKIYRYL